MEVFSSTSLMVCKDKTLSLYEYLEIISLYLKSLIVVLKRV